MAAPCAVAAPSATRTLPGALSTVAAAAAPDAAATAAANSAPCRAACARRCTRSSSHASRTDAATAGGVGVAAAASGGPSPQCPLGGRTGPRGARPSAIVSRTPPCAAMQWRVRLLRWPNSTGQR